METESKREIKQIRTCDVILTAITSCACYMPTFQYESTAKEGQVACRPLTVETFSQLAHEGNATTTLLKNVVVKINIRIGITTNFIFLMLFFSFPFEIWN